MSHALDTQPPRPDPADVPNHALAAAAAAERAPTRPTEALPVEWTSPPTRFIDVGHSRIAYRAVGHGPDVVFVHGWPLHGATFRGLLPSLIDRYTCHLIDLPGAGFTEWDSQTPISIRDHAHTLRCVIDAIGTKRYAVAAHDSGGTIARWAVAGDDRLAAMVLGNTEIPGFRAPLLRLYLALAALPAGKRLLGVLLGLRFVRRSRLVLGSCFGDPDFAEGEFEQLFIEPFGRSRRIAAGQMRLLETFDWRAVDELTDVHAQIRAPVQLVWGTDDPFFPLRHARSMMSQFGGETELSTIDGGKLLVHEESAHEFGAAMGTFLDRHLG